MRKVLVIATSAKTRGGITSVIKAHKRREQWAEFGCRWIETHRDGPALRKILYFVRSYIQFILLLPWYEVVHIHVASRSSAIRKSLFIAPARIAGRKIIVHFHPDTEKLLFDNGNSRLYRYIFNSASVVLVLSPIWKRWLEEALSISQRVEVLHNPCPEVNRVESVREKRILYAGSIIRRKGYDTIINAFARIAGEYPDWKITFAGNGETERARALAIKAGIEDQVEFAGWVNGREKERLFRRSSIYCMASVGEGFPMGVLDAWAYGLPCILTPVGGIPDIVRDGVNGVTFTPGDEAQLSECMRRLISDPDTRRRIAGGQDESVYGDFSLDNVTRRLGEIYRNL